ncbi:hypothetical protein [Undibacterium sp. TJN19]|uniref:hypothetical protein n=1 Tax=Undibacterium sp. TJN19 TaxID=3413055 RepID=UPI003BF1465D
MGNEAIWQTRSFASVANMMQAIQSDNLFSYSRNFKNLPLIRNSHMKEMSLKVITDFPAGTGPFPTLIMAPGLRYDMQSPAIVRIAGGLLAQGFAVFRFNWKF